MNGFCPHDQWPAICGEPECVERWRNTHGFHMGGCSGRHSWRDGERFCILNEDAPNPDSMPDLADAKRSPT